MNGPIRQQTSTNSRRLRQTIQRVEQQPYDYVPPVRGPRPPMQCVLAKVTADISGRSGTTAGSGTAQMQTFDGTDLADGPTEVPVANFAAGPIAAGKYCIIGSFGTAWFVVSVEC